jgi:hypothetical protein
LLLAAADKEALDKWYETYSGKDPLVNKINDAWYTFDCSVKHIIVVIYPDQGNSPPGRTREKPGVRDLL